MYKKKFEIEKLIFPQNYLFCNVDASIAPVMECIVFTRRVVYNIYDGCLCHFEITALGETGMLHPHLFTSAATHDGSSDVCSYYRVATLGAACVRRVQNSRKGFIA